MMRGALVALLGITIVEDRRLYWPGMEFDLKPIKERVYNAEKIAEAEQKRARKNAKRLKNHANQ